MTLMQRNPARRKLNSELPSQPHRRMTEAEFVKWCTDFWAEWVDGEVVLMSPVNLDHADIHSFLVTLMRGLADKHQAGRVWTEPFQIRLARQRRRRSPDIFFLAEAHADRLHRTYLEGAPDLIVEIVSPDSESRDWREKFGEYQSAGVPEYWIIDPASHRLEAYSLGHGKKYKLIAEKSGKVTSAILPGFHLRPAWFAASKLPPVHQVLKELGV